MTFKEKLQKEHPEKIDERYPGGCQGCPIDIRHETKNKDCNKIDCVDCWNREVPTEENTTKNLSDITEVFICEKCGVHLQDFFEQKYEKNGDYNYEETFECSYCPKCGKKVAE